jgi:restriction system protein
VGFGNLNKKSQNSISIVELEKEVEESLDWKERLLNTILSISPNAFEKLVQRLLRESGFVEVEVTGRSGDGGIDGKGIARMSGLLSFHVIFHCKRYKGSISPSQIRDFRGAKEGRADKGIFITTGSFTREARKEATRDGAPPIDLIDGELLCEKFKEFSLGVKTKVVEEIEIDEDFFSKF